ncbi:MAG: acyl carrier protein [Armatimonadetes bacterium]|nr:acyl carrier protein [Armatimonadota bacterium]
MTEPRTTAGELDPEFARQVRAALFQVTTRDLGTLTTDRELAELGLDSVSTVEMLVVLEDELGITLEQDDLEQVRTFGDLQKLIQDRRAGS